MVRGHLFPCFLPLDSRRLRRLDLKIYRIGGGVIVPRDNVFPGPAVAIDGPACTALSSNSLCEYLQQTHNEEDIDILPDSLKKENCQK